MAQQVTGHVYLSPSQFDTYDHWRYFCLTHGVDFDGWYGNQCYDICALLYFQYGLTFYLGWVGYAYEAWTQSKYLNARSPFIAIDNIWQVKRGDLLVFGTGWSIYGHVAFADEDYNGGSKIWCVGQNQGQGIAWGTPSISAPLDVWNFIGAFRNTNWSSTPPTPPSPVSEKGKGFPWAVLTRKLRQRH